MSDENEMSLTRQPDAQERVLTVGEEGGSVPLEPRPDTGDDKEECRPGNTPPREIRLKGAVVEEFLPVESLLFVSIIYTSVSLSRFRRTKEGSQKNK